MDERSEESESAEAGEAPRTGGSNEPEVVPPKAEEKTDDKVVRSRQPNLLHKLGLSNVVQTTSEHVLINNTGRRIGICPLGDHSDESAEGCKHDQSHLHGHLVLAPFGERHLSEEDLQAFDTEPWTARNLVELHKASEQNDEQNERLRVSSGLWSAVPGVVRRPEPLVDCVQHAVSTIARPCLGTHHFLARQAAPVGGIGNLGHRVSVKLMGHRAPVRVRQRAVGE